MYDGVERALYKLFVVRGIKRKKEEEKANSLCFCDGCFEARVSVDKRKML
jgi:hypothetical protein